MIFSRPRLNFKKILAALLGGLLPICASAVDAIELAEIKATQKQLISLSLTELLEIEVTSVAKKKPESF